MAVSAVLHTRKNRSKLQAPGGDRRSPDHTRRTRTRSKPTALIESVVFLFSPVPPTRISAHGAAQYTHARTTTILCTKIKFDFFVQFILFTKNGTENRTYVRARPTHRTVVSVANCRAVAAETVIRIRESLRRVNNRPKPADRTTTTR